MDHADDDCAVLSDMSADSQEPGGRVL